MAPQNLGFHVQHLHPGLFFFLALTHLPHFQVHLSVCLLPPGGGQGLGGFPTRVGKGTELYGKSEIWIPVQTLSFCILLSVISPPEVQMGSQGVL